MNKIFLSLLSVLIFAECFTYPKNSKVKCGIGITALCLSAIVMSKDISSYSDYVLKGNIDKDLNVNSQSGLINKKENPKKINKETLEKEIHEVFGTLANNLHSVPVSDIYKHKETIKNNLEDLKSIFRNLDEEASLEFPDAEKRLLAVDVDKIIKDFQELSLWNSITKIPEIYSNLMSLKELFDMLSPETQNVVFSKIENPIVRAVFRCM